MISSTKHIIFHDIHDEHDGTLWELVQQKYWKKAHELLSEEDYDAFLGINHENP